MDDDDPIADAIERSKDERERFTRFIDALRESDPAFAEASVLYPDDMSEWQAGVYLLTGNDLIWRRFGAAVMEGRSIGVITEHVKHGERPWSSSEWQVLVWSAHFWDVQRKPIAELIRFPWEFERFLFRRWATAVHLRKTIAPGLGAPPS